MKLPRRKFLHLSAGAIALPAVSRFARAEIYPSRPVRLIVPFGPAGSTDITARLVGQWLSERLGQQFIIENRPGAGGNLGTEAVVRAPADGHTLLMVGSWSAINATLYGNHCRETNPHQPPGKTNQGAGYDPAKNRTNKTRGQSYQAEGWSKQ